MSDLPTVAIHYQRPPDRITIFTQRVVYEDEEVIVTLSEPLDVPERVFIGADVMLDPGALAVWFTFPGAWHDIARFHTRDGDFTGFYANILTPPDIDGRVWHTTDLYLDIWWPRGGEPRVLDEDELEAAIDEDLLEPDVVASARTEAARLMREAGDGRWPPPVAEEWTLARALERVGGG